MIKQDTPGSEPRKPADLNVEVNLLAEWSEKRDRARREASRSVLQLALAAVVAGVTLPALLELHAVAGRRNELAENQLRSARARLTAVQARFDAAKPLIEGKELRQALASECDQFFYEAALVLNAGSPSMAIDTMHVEASNGKLVVHCTADADSSATARSFMQRAGIGRNVTMSEPASMRRNLKFGPEGVSFSYEKTVEAK